MFPSHGCGRNIHWIPWEHFLSRSIGIGLPSIDPVETPSLIGGGNRYKFTLDPVGTLSLTGYRYRFTLDPVGTLSLTGYRYRFTLDPVETLSLTEYRYRFTLDPVETLSLTGYRYRFSCEFLKCRHLNRNALLLP